jgi:hypothetical protein
MPTSVSTSPGAPFADQDATLRLALGIAADEICGHRQPATPDWIPCQRPPGHDPEYGHRDSAGANPGHVWLDDGCG